MAVMLRQWEYLDPSRKGWRQCGLLMNEEEAVRYGKTNGVEMRPVPGTEKTVGSNEQGPRVRGSQS